MEWPSLNLAGSIWVSSTLGKPGFFRVSTLLIILFSYSHPPIPSFDGDLNQKLIEVNTRVNLSDNYSIFQI